MILLDGPLDTNPTIAFQRQMQRIVLGRTRLRCHKGCGVSRRKLKRFPSSLGRLLPSSHRRLVLVLYHLWILTRENRRLLEVQCSLRRLWFQTRMLSHFQWCVVQSALPSMEGTILTQLHLQPPPTGIQLITPQRVLSITMLRGLRHSQVEDLLRNKSFQCSLYLDDTTFTWFNNGVEEFTDLDEVMGSDDGENFDYNGNLDT